MFEIEFLLFVLQMYLSVKDASSYFFALVKLFGTILIDITSIPVANPVEINFRMILTCFTFTTFQ